MRQRLKPSGLLPVFEHMRRADQQRAMQAATGNGVGHRKAPIRKQRLHQLKSMRHPFHASEQGGFIHRRIRLAFQFENNFGFDARFRQSFEMKRPLLVAEIGNGAVVNVPPDRLMDIIFIPDRAVGKTDFAPQRCFAFLDAAHAQRGGNLVGVLRVEAMGPLRERQGLPAGAQQFHHLVGDGGKWFLVVNPPHDEALLLEDEGKNLTPRGRPLEGPACGRDGTAPDGLAPDPASADVRFCIGRWQRNSADERHNQRADWPRLPPRAKE